MAQTTAFTYQGKLTDNATPANGTYEFQFTLKDSVSAGNQVGSVVTAAPVPVSNGVFTVTLDFGGGVFTGANRWLEIGVRTNASASAYTVLEPRQPITSAPYAVQALNAATAASVAAANLTGAISLAQLPVSVLTNNSTGVSLNGAFIGNGAGLTNLPGAGGSIVGLRTEPNVGTGAPNLIGGAPINVVGAGVIGATISGGGTTNYFDTPFTNSILANFGTIGGGYANTIQINSVFAVIGAGRFNSIGIGADESTIGGGIRHWIQDGAFRSTISGGEENTVKTNAYYSTIAGGYLNNALGAYSFIAGGDRNAAAAASFAAGTRARATNSGSFVWSDSTDADFPSTANNQFSVRAGGGVRMETGGAGLTVDGSPVVSGAGLRIQANATSPNVIGGYTGNFVAPGVAGAVIGGGGLNLYTNSIFAGYSTIGGGEFNTIDAIDSIIGGGFQNSIQNGAGRSSISGGAGNVIHALANSSAIGGGEGNEINDQSPGGVIGGGAFNSIGEMAGSAVIGGGDFNVVLTNGTWGTIPGGELNAVTNRAFAAGTQAKAIHTGAFVWADSTATDFSSTANNQFSVRAGGGVRMETGGAGLAVDGAAVVTAAALRLQSGPGSANLIGGYVGNFVAAGVAGSTIAGGGKSLDTNSVFTDFSSIGGGRGNSIQAFANESTIGGGVGNSILYAANDSTISGGAYNSIQTNAAVSTIAGGYGNSIQTNAHWSAIGGGGQNTIETNAWESIIGGGVRNTIRSGAYDATIGGGADNTNHGTYATLGGGSANVIQDASNAVLGGGGNNLIEQGSGYGVMGGGENNRIKGSYFVTIGGGSGNTVSNSSEYATIGGGNQNQAGAPGSTIAGGSEHGISGSADYATIAGGRYNRIRLLAQYSAISGGWDNEIQRNAQFSAIVGGQLNTVQSNADYAIILGGRGNVAASYAFAAGHNAQATNFGSFVWGDGSTSLTPSTADNSVTMRASGGFRFFTDTGTAGVQLTAGGAGWSSISDRNAKKNFQPLDAQEVLAKLTQMPIQHWNYKWEKDSDVPHIGPVAQDFKAAFYPGRDEKSISTLEFDGVALAAIQGLNQKVDAGGQKAETRIQKSEESIQKLRAENTELKQRLADLEKLVQSLAQAKGDE